MSSQWRWPVDDETPQGDGKPSAKILPFAVNPMSPAAPSAMADSAADEPVASTEWVRAMLTEAFDRSFLSKIREEDQEALEDERAFRKRFGFDANREQRRQLIAFKHDADVTDAEIRILRKSGSLSYRPGGVDILAPTVIAAWGYAQIIAIGVVMVLPILMFGFKPRISWPIFFGVAAFEAALVYLVKLSDDMYIRPHWIRKRVLRQAARKID